MEGYLVSQDIRDRLERALRRIESAEFEPLEREQFRPLMVPPSSDTLYKLNAVLTPGSTSAVAAYKGTWTSGSPGSWRWADQTTNIQDPLGRFWGMKGDTVKVDGNGNITATLAPPVYFVTLGAVLNSGSTASATGPNSSSITVTDVLLPSGFSFANDSTIPIMPDVNGNRWVDLSPKFAAVSPAPLTGLTIDDENEEIQTQTTPIAVLAAQAQTSAETIYTGTECPEEELRLARDDQKRLNHG
jgi:hypothetical protein